MTIDRVKWRHWLLLAAIAATVAFCAFMLWKMWKSNDLHQTQTDLALSQKLMVSEIQVHLTTLLEAPDNNDAATRLKQTVAELKVLQTQNQDNFNQFLQSHPSLHSLYAKAPYLLTDRLNRIIAFMETDPPLNNDTLHQLQTYADNTFYNGLDRVASEIDHDTEIRKESLVPALLLALASVFLLLLAYHKWIFLALLDRHKASEAETLEAREERDTLSLTDPLTGTSNRKAITRFLSDFQRKHTADGEFIALAILDIDHFQQINDVLGYFAGDEVLKEVAIRINNQLRSEDQLGRINADHFAIVLSGLIAPKTAESIIHRIQEGVARPIAFRDTTINVTCSVGAAVQEVNSLDLAELFKLSEQALLQAKENRRGSIFLFSENAQAALSRQREIVNVVKESNFDDIFELVYQPIVALDTGKIAGCECLLRWTAATPANLQTAELVPTLEMYGDIHEVGAWVLREGFQQLQHWKTLLADSSLFVSVNISAIQLEASNFPDRIVALAQEFEITPGDISLELTETVAIKHLEAGRKQLALLRNLGFGISLDDFGTGYSSLQYLKSMPASTIKIDQAFVREMTNDKCDAAIVESAIHIAKAIGLAVVAEGIDKTAQADRLRAIGCHYGQGYFFFKPLSKAAFEQAVLAQQQAV